MHKSFYWGRKMTLLFDSWRTKTWTGYTISLLLIALLAVFYQYMEDRHLRFKTLTFLHPRMSIESPLLGPVSKRRPSSVRAAVAVLFGVNSVIGYILMLAVMSFNAGVFVSVVLGLVVGYFVFRSSGEGILVHADEVLRG